MYTSFAVHCNDGMSRAPSLVIGYIMQTFGLTYKVFSLTQFCITLVFSAFITFILLIFWSTLYFNQGTRLLSQTKLMNFLG
jgi:hypothetical protein